MPINLKKKYQTRNGLEVELWKKFKDRDGWFVIGIITTKDGFQESAVWPQSGYHFSKHMFHELDLVEIVT